jgi:hypothetical protein
MVPDNITILTTSNGGQGPDRLPSKLQLLKWSLVGWLGLAVAMAFLFAAVIIGLLIALPLVVVGMFWLIVMVWRGKVRIRREFPS